MKALKDNIDKILKNHNDFFLSGLTKSVDFRLNQLLKLKNAIKKNEQLIFEALYKDLHKSKFEAYATEVGFLLDNINYIMKKLKSWTKVKKVKTPFFHVGAKSYIHHEPYGTVLIVGPFNYPFQLIFEPLIGAIAAGNCAVIKPSENTPNVTEVIKKIIEENFDKAYVSVICGGKEITSELIHSAFDYIFFTGSVRVGKIVMEAASKNLVPVTLELGGKSPCIVDNSANLDVAAKRIVFGKFLNTGQTCVAPDYLLVHKDIKKELIDKLIHMIKEFYGENPSFSKDFGRIINKSQLNRLIDLIESDKVTYGGKHDKENLYLSPTIMDNVSWNDKVMEDEIFGPILPIIQYEDLDNIINKINTRPKPLALYIFAENKKVYNKLITSISYGGGCINETLLHITTPYLPFGGVGNSGIGAYHGKYSFELFSHKKSIMKKSTKFDIDILFPPYNERKFKFLKRFYK